MNEAAQPADKQDGDEGASGPRRRRPRREDGSRRDQRLPEIRVTATERSAIEAGAERVQMSTAAYLRALGLGHDPPSKVDLRAIHELGRLRADLGRLGGLLKLWLTDRAGEGTEASDVSRVLAEIEQRQAEWAARRCIVTAKQPVVKKYICRKGGGPSLTAALRGALGGSGRGGEMALD